MQVVFFSPEIVDQIMLRYQNYVSDLKNMNSNGPSSRNLNSSTLVTLFSSTLLCALISDATT